MNRGFYQTLSASLLVSVIGLSASLQANAVLNKNQFPESKTISGFHIASCNPTNATPGTRIDFCGTRAIKAYKNLAKAKNINFNKKYVLVSFAGIDDGYRFADYAAVDPATKNVFPFMFQLSNANSSLPPKIYINKKTDTICSHSSTNFDGDAELYKSYGGNSVNNPDVLCFRLTESDGFDPIPLPTKSAN